jgi:hypothetical protein
MARDDLHFRLRIPEDLKERIGAEALANHRSMTAEIIARLEASFAQSSAEAVEMRADTIRLERQQEELRRKIEAVEAALTKLDIPV